MTVERYQDICLVDERLRDYQQEAKESIFKEWDSYNHVMFQMPTGTGKTRLFTSIIHDINRYSVAIKQPVKILIIAHRTELIDQIDESLGRYSVAHGIIAGSHKQRDYKMPVQVASIQTITNQHNLAQAQNMKVQFIIIDEAHHSLAQTYQKLWEIYPNAKILGVTATPWRMNGSGFLSLYEKLIKSLSIKKFINKGWLSVYKYYSLKPTDPIQQTIDSIDEFDIEGDYKISALEREIDIRGIRAQLLKSYQTLANGKKGIIYSISQEHSKHICNDFSQAGINIVSIDSKTPAKERKELVNKFKHGDIDIIVNVDIFSEGFDCPDIEFIQLARPTRSLAKYLQQVGRGLRITANKQACIILDNVGLYNRFGLPDANRHWDYHFRGQEVVEVEDPITDTEPQGTRKQDFTEGDENMVLVENLVKEESFKPLDLLSESDKLNSYLRKWIVEQNNNSLISFTTAVQNNHMDYVKTYFSVIQDVLHSGINTEQYLNFIACMLNCDTNMFVKTIAETNYEITEDLNEKSVELLNAIIDPLFSNDKVQHSISIVLPFAKYLSSESREKIRKRGRSIHNPHKLIALAHIILQLDPRGSINYLLQLKTMASKFAVYMILVESKSHRYFKPAEISQHIQPQLNDGNFDSKMINRCIDHTMFGYSPYPIKNIEKYEQGDYETFEKDFASIVAKQEHKKEDKTKLEGQIVTGRFSARKHNYTIFELTGGLSKNVLIPNQYVKDNFQAYELFDVRIVKTYPHMNYVLGCPANMHLTEEEISQTPILKVGDQVDLRFKIINKELTLLVQGYTMVKGSLAFRPKGFDYKKKHHAVVHRVKSLFEYTFVIKDHLSNTQ